MIQNGDDVPISQPHPNCFLNICSGGSADDQQLKTSPERHLTGTTVGQVVFDAQEHIFLRIFQPPCKQRELSRYQHCPCQGE
jgi:hypothetical protein